VKNFLAFVAIVLAGGGVVAGSVFLFFFFTAPRMKEQIHIRAYQTVAFSPPRGSVPARKAVTVEDSARDLAGGAPATAAELQNGQTFYTYYCVFCHGERGDGIAAVGASYDPAPADLRTARVRAMQPAQLLKAMLTGVGHEPVLEMVVHPQYRRALALYVHALAQGQTIGGVHE